MKLPTVIFLSSACLTAVAQETESFGNCTVDSYYTDLDGSFETWSLSQLNQLLSSTHRKSLPITGKEGELNANDALIDLDAGFASSADLPSVRLHLRDIDFEASTLNTPEGWRRGDLWPHERNAGPNTLAGTDVHAKRPVDWEVNTVTANLFWGECGTVEDPARCVTPAVPDQNTAPTTAQDGKIKTPPVSMRGDIARSLFYTQVRYSEDLQLKLTDCPPFEGNEYGYLSELLRWHIEDPVDDRERIRNEKACSMWQGNRNPFVDYPDMVNRLFGEPDSILEGTRTYSRCQEATVTPTVTPNACSSLEPGDVNVIIFNTDPVDQIVFFPLNDIPESVGSLFVTDQAWDGKNFVTTEGTLEYIIPEGGIKAGTVFGYGVTFPLQKGEWVESEDETLFDMRTVDSDSLLVYCMNADGKEIFLSAVTYNDNGFADPGLSSYNPGETSVPEELQDAGNLALPFAPHYLYNGPLEGVREELLEALGNPSNFQSSSEPFEINTSKATGTAPLLFTLAVVAICALCAFI